MRLKMKGAQGAIALEKHGYVLDALNAARTL